MAKKQARLDPDRDTKVTQSSIEWEWFRQSHLFWEYSKLEAKADEEKGDAKLELDILEAELEYEIRDDPNKFRLEESFKEAEVKAAIKRSKRWKKARKELLKKTRIAKEMAGVVRSLEHKKRSLEKLSDRQQAGIYSEPRAPKPRAPKWYSDRQKKLDKDTAKKLRKGLNRRKKRNE